MCSDLPSIKGLLAPKLICFRFHAYFRSRHDILGLFHKNNFDQKILFLVKNKQNLEL